jgi:predicted DCC family thiol-disulfide oxidoreductase YuxK
MEGGRAVMGARAAMTALTALPTLKLAGAALQLVKNLARRTFHKRMMLLNQ